MLSLVGLVAVPALLCAGLSAVYTAQPDANSRKAALCLTTLAIRNPKSHRRLGVQGARVGIGHAATLHQTL